MVTIPTPVTPVSASSSGVVLHNKSKTLIKTLIIAVFIVVGIITLVYNVSLVLPRSINFAFSETTCFFQPIALPNLFDTQSKDFNIGFSDGIRISNNDIFTTKVCASPKNSPQENTKSTATIALFNLVPIKKITINSGKYPSIDTSALNSPIATTKPIQLSTNKETSIFSYQLVSESNITNCSIKQLTILCPLQELSLTPGSKPTLKINRTYSGNLVDSVFNDQIQTLDPINIVGGNILNNSTIYDKAETLEIAFDKPLSKVDKPLLSLIDKNSTTPLETSYTINNNKLIVKPKESLKRRSKYSFKLDQATSTTDNTLLSAYSSEFNVSGGPSVIGNNTGSYGFNPSSNITIKFNQNINSATKLTDVIDVSGVNQALLKISATNNMITINPTTNLPSCTSINIKINGSIQNQYGVDGDSAWNHTFRTLCRRTSQIGTSAQGRAILAHWYGSGSSMVMFVGGIHGNEKSSTLTMESWLDELERYADRIPANRTIVVITNANPDGYAGNSRFNANGVDLNRNFPSDNWSANVTGPGYTNKINGGGTSPLSEPESSSLANFVNQYRPRAVLSFHAVASIVSPNGAADSTAIAQLYTSKAPYGYADASQTDATLGYTTTGDFEFWLRDKGIPNILIEQSTLAKNEFSKNRDALWLMVRL